jgi:hypothetical protein
MNIIGGNFGGSHFKMVLADTNDIAEVGLRNYRNLTLQVFSSLHRQRRTQVQMILQKHWALPLASPNFYGCFQ